LGVLIYGAGQRRAKAGLVCAAIGIVNRVGVTQELRGVAIVVLQDDIGGDIGFSRRAIDAEFVRPAATERDHLGMQDLLALAELLNEFLDAILVIMRLALGLGDALVEK